MGPPQRQSWDHPRVHHRRCPDRSTRRVPVSGSGERRWRSGRFACSRSGRFSGCGWPGRVCGGVERLAGMDRKTIRRYIAAAEVAGITAGGGDAQLSDEVVGQVVEAVRPHRTDGHGEAWRVVGAHHDRIAGWVKGDLTAVKIHELLAREGTVVPLRTVQRYVAEVCGRTRGQGPTVRVADGEPGAECQLDFGKMGLVPDPTTGRMRVVHALVFTACFSRHQFVWLSHRQTTEAVIAGCEAAWAWGWCGLGLCVTAC